MSHSPWKHRYIPTAPKRPVVDDSFLEALRRKRDAVIRGTVKELCGMCHDWIKGPAAGELFDGSSICAACEKALPR